MKKILIPLILFFLFGIGYMAFLWEYKTDSDQFGDELIPYSDSAHWHVITVTFDNQEPEYLKPWLSYDVYRVLVRGAARKRYYFSPYSEEELAGCKKIRFEFGDEYVYTLYNMPPENGVDVAYLKRGEGFWAKHYVITNLRSYDNMMKIFADDYYMNEYFESVEMPSPKEVSKEELQAMYDARLSDGE